MSRYINTERTGVIATDSIVTNQLGWIFREQPIVDVGIDALIEQVEDGNPTGRFLAVQIKTGAGNFYISETKLTHYVSHIHYNYWLNLEIPIILIAHIPETAKTYWQLIDENNFNKVRKQWKIDIPQKQEFNEKSKNRLIQILSNRNQKSYVFDLYKGKVESDTLFDFAENTKCIEDAGNCVSHIVETISDIGKKTAEQKEKLDNYFNLGLSDNDPQVKASIKGYSKDLNVCSKRLESEINLFSELYSEGLYAYEQVVLLHFLFTKEPKNLDSALISLEMIPKSVDNALAGIIVMREGVSKLPNKYAVLKEAKMLLLDVIGLIITEFTESKEIANKIIEKIRLNK